MSERSEYGYSDGTREYKSFIEGLVTLPEGWYFFPASWAKDARKLASFEDAVDHFINQSMRLTTGPDYEHIPLVIDSETRYHLVKQVRRLSETNSVNDHLLRGWTIIGIEYEGSAARGGEGLVHRKASFILAHADDMAI